MADYSAIKSYLRKNLHYFTFSPNSDKAAILHLPSYTLEEDICNSLEYLGFNVVNLRQMTTIRRAPNGQTQVEPLHLFYFILTRNIKSQDMFKLYGLNHIIIKNYTESRLALRNATTVKTLAILSRLQVTSSMFVVLR
jgi:hypothetical protein